MRRLSSEDWPSDGSASAFLISQFRTRTQVCWQERVYKSASRGIQRRVEAGTKYVRRESSVQRFYVVLACLADDIAFVNRFIDANEAQRLLGQLNRGYRKQGLRVFVTENSPDTTTTWSEMRAKLRGTPDHISLPLVPRIVKPVASGQQWPGYDPVPPWEDYPEAQSA